MYKKIMFSLMTGIASLGFMCADVEAANPVGNVQVATSAVTNQLHVRGTAYDPDDMSRPVRLHVYVGGTPGQNVPQYEIRTNPHTRVFDDIRNIGGSKTGFQKVHVYALNDVGSGQNVEIWNGTVYIKSGNHNPVIGNIQIDSPEPGKLHVKCTGVVDDDNVNGDVRLHVYVGGGPGSSPSVVPQYQIVASGRTHVIEDTRIIERTGNQVVSIYALNDYGPGSNVKAYSNTVYIKPTTVSNYTTHRVTFSNGQVVDTFNGVEAKYTYGNCDTNEVYSCAALVKRYYSKVYGVNVYNLLPNKTPIADGKYLKQVSSPQVGDVVGMTNSSGVINGHWGIVKAIEGSNIVLFEQNFKKSEQRTITVNRKINFSGCRFYRL